MQPCICPLNHGLRIRYCLSVLLFRDRLLDAWIPCSHSISSQIYRSANATWNGLSARLKDYQKTCQVMHVRKVDVARYHQCLNGLLGRLLSLKAQILQIGAWNPVLRHGQIASGAIYPFSRIIWRKAFRKTRTQPVPPEAQA